MKNGLLASFAIALATLSAYASAHDRQGFETVHAFDMTKGSVPYTGDLLRVKDGIIGTTQSGGDQSVGTLYQFNTATGMVKVLHNFHQDGVDGFQPEGGLTSGLNNTVIGVAPYGGSYYSGAAFSYNISNGEYKVLHAFQGGAFDGAMPAASVIAETGTSFLGTAQFGGASGQGVIYRMTIAGTVTLVHTFSGPDGRIPQYGLTRGPDGAFYGVANFGGNNDAGTIYKITSNGAFTVVYSFDSATTGTNPTRLVLGHDGKFCDGQVFSDTSIGCCFADSRSKALGDKFPRVECSRVQL